MRGGERKGAGRKTPDNIRTKQYKVMLDDAGTLARKAQRIGGGNISYGIRKALREFKEEK